MELFYILIGVITLAGYNVARIYDKYTFKIKLLKFNLTKTLAAGSKLIFINSLIEINNPTSNSVKIDDLLIVLSFNNIPIGKANLKTGKLIEQQSTIIFPFEIVLNADSFLKSALLREALSDIFNNQSIEVNLKGYIKTGLFKIPFNTNKTLEV